MKKTYQKPRILFEHLELDSVINACDYLIAGEDPVPNDGVFDTPIKKADSVDGTVEIWFSDVNSQCKHTTGCYDVPNFTFDDFGIQFSLS